MFDGQFATAMSYAEEVERQLDPEAVTFKLEPPTICCSVSGEFW